jgi:hypothetical protein
MGKGLEKEDILKRAFPPSHYKISQLFRRAGAGLRRYGDCAVVVSALPKMLPAGSDGGKPRERRLRYAGRDISHCAHPPVVRRMSAHWLYLIQ